MRYEVSMAVLALACAALSAQDLPSERGPSIAGELLLAQADEVLVASGTSYDFELDVASDGRSLSYRFRNYVKDRTTQRAVSLEPSFQRGDSAIRKGETAYFKYRDWPRYEAMSARGSFLDSPFAWVDAMWPGLAGAYEVVEATEREEGAGRAIRCTLKPLEAGGYSRIDLVLDASTLRTIRRVYYTPSGARWKTAEYGGYAARAGEAAGWRVTMTNEMTGSRATMIVGARERDTRPDGFYEPVTDSEEK